MSRMSEALKVLRGGEVKAAPVPGSDIVLGSVSASTISTAQIDRAMDGAAKVSSVLAAALVFSSRNFAEAPLVVMRNGEPDYTHPLSRAFSRPTPWHSQTAFWQRFVMLLLTDPGGAYIVAAHDDSGEVGALWARSSRHVRPRLSPTEYISGWKFVTNGFEQDVDPDRFTVVRQQFPSPEPNDEFYSLCPIEQVRKEVRTHVTASLWLDNILQNMGVSSGLIGVDHQALDQKTAKAVQDELNERLGGPQRGGTFAVLAGKVTVDELGMKLGDLDFGPLMDRVEVAVSRAFGIPAELLQVLATVGKGEGLNSSAYREKARVAYDNSIIPLWKDIAEAVGTFIGPLYDLGPEDVAFDYSGVEALADDKLKRFQTAVAALPFVELNEAREIAGFEPKPWGDINIQASVYGRLAQPVKSASATERKAVGDPRMEWYLRWDAKATASEPAIERAARSAFAEEAEAVKKAISGAGSPADIEREAVAAIDPDAWVAKMTGPITATLATGYAEVQAALVPAKAAPEGVTGLSDPMAVQAALEQVAKLAGEVTQTTKDRIAELVAQGIENGWSPDQVADAIAEHAFGGEVTKTRAVTIARTESVAAMSRGGLLGAKDVRDRLGMTVKKAWLTAGMDARPLHLQAEAAGFVDLESDFGVGAEQPGGFGIAGENVNCRCTLVYEAQ